MNQRLLLCARGKGVQTWLFGHCPCGAVCVSEGHRIVGSSFDFLGHSVDACREKLFNGRDLSHRIEHWKQSVVAAVVLNLDVAPFG